MSPSAANRQVTTLLSFVTPAGGPGRANPLGQQAFRPSLTR